MANWDPITVREAIARIRDDAIVLPVIQRRLVWDEDKMELLFDTLLRSNSFGGIMSIEEEKDNRPIFAFRKFTVDGTIVQSQEEEALPKTHNLIIDGQQRLQSFYIGLCGSINGKQLYFDLFSDYQESDFNFRFASSVADLPVTDDDKDHIKECLWLSTNYLYTKLDALNDDDQLSDYIKDERSIIEPERIKTRRKNLRLFYNNVFNQKHVGIARVTMNRLDDVVKSRQKIVELFRRLNDGGTKLSAFDLAASKMKGFDWKMESFLDDVLHRNAEIGLSQDNLLKLVFLLRNDFRKEMMDIDETDAAFAVANKERIDMCLSLTLKFLKMANLLGYYTEKRPSFIPIFFICYHLYYLEIETAKLEGYFDNFDTSNNDYKHIYRWVVLSLLNGVFKSRGAGWIPYKTGIRKILIVMKSTQGKLFPCAELFATYRAHPLVFTEDVNEYSIRQFDKDIIFNLLYNSSDAVREQDIDHIQPYTLLSQIQDYQNITNIIENYQLLDSGTNRGVKRAKPLNEWILNDVQNKQLYLARHFIPRNEEVWKIENYKQFISDRRDLLISKIKTSIEIA